MFRAGHSHNDASSLIFAVIAKREGFCTIENASVALQPYFPAYKDD
jgi:hypothetical protein